MRDIRGSSRQKILPTAIFFWCLSQFLQAAEQRSARLMAVLRGHYGTALARDPELLRLLDRVEEVASFPLIRCIGLLA